MDPRVESMAKILVNYSTKVRKGGELWRFTAENMRKNL